MGNPRRQLHATLHHIAPSPAGHTDRSGRVLGDAVALKKPPLSRASQALKKDGVGATNQSDAGRTPGGRVSLATCQFHITDDIEENVTAVLAQMREAAAQGAQLVHFSECCLSGYAGVEFATFDGFDWPALVAATHRVQPTLVPLEQHVKEEGVDVVVEGLVVEEELHEEAQVLTVDLVHISIDFKD